MTTKLDETPLYQDALLELGNMAFSHATTALSNLVGVRVDVSCPEFRILPAPTVADVTGSQPSEYHVAMVRVFGDRRGSISLVMARSEARVLCRLLAIEAAEPADAEVEAILAEVANIMSGSALLAIHKFLRVSLVHGHASLRTVQAGEDASQVRVSAAGEVAIVITTRFEIKGQGSTGWLLISLDDIEFFLDALDRAMGET